MGQRVEPVSQRVGERVSRGEAEKQLSRNTLVANTLDRSWSKEARWNALRC
jgi:hypothetical protein